MGAKARRPRAKKLAAKRTELVVILDRSGSMVTVQKDMEGGFGRMMAEQAKEPGECRVTLVQFDSGAVETVYASRAVADVPPLELIPRGCTPLLDAVGQTVTEALERFQQADPAPEAVLFLIITDGLENASVEWTKERVKQLITERRDAGWEFVYLGANVDAFAEAGELGISLGTTRSYHPDALGVQDMYSTASASVSRYRCGESASFTDEERKGTGG